MYIASRRRVNLFSGTSGDFCRLDRVRHVDELVLDGEPLRDQLPEPADAGRLGRVVTSGEEVDAVLARFAPQGLAGLAGDHGVESQRPRLVKGESARAGDD